MMICAADFEELFPREDKPENLRERKDAVSPRDTGPSVSDYHFHRMPPAEVGMAFAVMPAAAAYGAASAMMATYGRMLTRH